MSKRSGVYRIRNKTDGKIYIGQATDIHQRWSHHRWALRSGRHDNHHLQSSWIKHGEDTFDFSIVVYCRPPLLTENEQVALKGVPEHLRYNHAGPVESPNLGRKFSEEHRAKIGAGNKGKVRTPEMRKRLSAAKQGVVPRYGDQWRRSIALSAAKRRRAIVLIYPGDRREVFAGISLCARCIGSRVGTIVTAIKHRTRVLGAFVVYAEKDLGLSYTELEQAQKERIQGGRVRGGATNRARRSSNHTTPKEAER